MRRLIIRGGCYIYDSTISVRSARRYDYYPANRYSGYGARIVLGG